MSPAERALFNRWVAHRDAEAFAAIARQYGGLVYAVGRRITGSAQDAEDIAQACFEKLASQRKAPVAPLGPWLHRVATNHALDLIKAGKRRRDREARYQREHAGCAEIGWDDVYDLVDEAIAALPRRQRDAVVAHFLEGRTHEQIAQALGISRSAVTQRIHGGIAGIRKALRRRGLAVPAVALGALLPAAAEASVPAALAVRLGRIGLSGHTGTPAAGAGLWQALTGSLGSATGLITGGVVVAVLAGAGLLALNPGDQNPGSANPADSAPVSAAMALTPTGSDPITPPAPAVATSSDRDPVSPPPVPAGPEAARISGVVIDTQGNPVAGAQVRLQGTQDLQKGAGWVSDENGAFAFNHVAPTDHCWVGADIKRNGAERRGGQVQLESVLPGASHEVELTLYDGVIAGRVLDDRARPMPGVEVLASPQWAYKFGLPTALTDEAGRYRISGVMAGEYEMQIKPVEGSYAPTGVRVTSDGVGMRTHVNLTYRPPGGGVITGRVTDTEGFPIERAHVAFNLTVAPHTSGWIFTDAEGRYALPGIPEGPNLIRAQHFDHGDQVMRDVAVDGEAVDFVLPRRGTVRGEVVHALTGAPIPEFEMHTWEPTSDIHYFMVAERWKPVSDPEGRFEMVLKPGDQPVRVRAAGFSEANTSVTVPAGDVLDGVRIALTPALEIHGRVIDADTGGPVPGARIFRGPIPSEPLQVSQVLAHTDEEGAFLLPDGAPEGELISVTHPAYAAAWAETAPGEAGVTIAMAPGLDVSGLVSSNGVPVAGVPVHAVAPRRAQSALAQAETGPDGRFTLKGVPGSGVVFHARLEPPHAPQERTMYFSPEGRWAPAREGLHFPFQQDGAALVVTVLKSGAPVAGIHVYARQDLGGNVSDTVSAFTDASGRARFGALSEGAWAIQVYPHAARSPDDAITLEAELQADATLMLERDLDHPNELRETVLITPGSNPPHENPEDGDRVLAPLLLKE